MSQDLWGMITTINNFLIPLREAETKSDVSMVYLVELRSNLRTQLEAMRIALTEQYSERDAYYVLFPLTAHCDELVKKLILDTQSLEWPPLQQELYQVGDAGDLFFELLDNALSKPETLFLVYEVYYFCLQDGFCGRYSDSPDTLVDYLQKLRKHIHLQPIAALTSPLPTPTRRAYFRIPTYLYYCSASLFLMLVYFFLSNLANSWQLLQ